MGNKFFHYIPVSFLMGILFATALTQNLYFEDTQGDSTICAQKEKKFFNHELREFH